MKNAAACFLLVVPAFLSGCQSSPAPSAVERSLCGGFPVSSIHIAGLTQLVGGVEEGESQVLRIFVELRDFYGSKMKAPAQFRFELYSYVQHSSDPRGIQLRTWPDIDLSDQNRNHLYWRDYLRAYEFSLEISPPVSPADSFLLEVTCQTEEPRRISASYILNTK